MFRRWYTAAVVCAPSRAALLTGRYGVHNGVTANRQDLPSLDGRNLLATWKGQADIPDRTLFWEWRAEGYQQVAAMRGNLKWIRTGDEPPEAYDVEADPGERRSIIARHGTLARQLEEEVRSWLAVR